MFSQTLTNNLFLLMWIPQTSQYTNLDRMATSSPVCSIIHVCCTTKPCVHGVKARHRGLLQLPGLLSIRTIHVQDQTRCRYQHWWHDIESISTNEYYVTKHTVDIDNFGTISNRYRQMKIAWNYIRSISLISTITTRYRIDI